MPSHRLDSFLRVPRSHTFQGVLHQLHTPSFVIEIREEFSVAVVRGILRVLGFGRSRGAQEVLDVAQRGLADNVASDVGLPRRRVAVPISIRRYDARQGRPPGRYPVAGSFGRLFM